MLRKTINYIDLNGDQRTDVIYFNLSKVELVKMRAKGNGTYLEGIEEMLTARDTEKMVDFIIDLVVSAYGEKSEDGRRFIKSKEAQDAFVESMAFDELFSEFMSSPESLASFVKGVVPADVSATISENLKKRDAIDALVEDTGH